MNSKPPTLPASKNRPRQERLEAIRPFVKKYQYCQLPLPELAPTQESLTPDSNAGPTQAESHIQE